MRVDLLSVSLLDCHYANESPKEYVNGLIEPKKARKKEKRSNQQRNGTNETKKCAEI